MVAVDARPVTAGQESYVFPLNVDSGDVVKVFLLDAEGRPLCASARG